MTGIRLLEGVPAKDPDGNRSIDRKLILGIFQKDCFGQVVNLRGQLRLRPQAAEHAGVARERLVFRPLYLPADPPNTVSINLPVGVLGAHVAVEKNGVTLCPSINGSARCSLSVESPSSAKAENSTNKGHRDNSFDGY